MSTLKTVLRYYKSVLHRVLPIGSRSTCLDDISNYLKIDDALATAGQPTEGEMKLVRDAGFATVINLAPADSANALRDERGCVEALGLTYIHIPVDFKQPTDADFQTFCAAMSTASRPVFVHCAANMRVSAFVYRYRRDIRGEPAAAAEHDLHRIWQPAGVWKKFIDTH